MHYYQFNIGDYHTHTTHLSDLEDLAFRRMLDWSYLHEKPLPLDVEEIGRLIRMRTHCDCITNVLREYFEVSDEGYSNLRVIDEVHRVGTKSEKASASARARWGKKLNKIIDLPINANALRTECDGNATHYPLPETHNPLPNTEEKKEKKHRGSRLPTDFSMPDDWFDFCKQERSDLMPDKVFDSFKDFWIAKAGAGGVKLDWLATWRNWVRNQKAPQSSQLTFAQRDMADRKKRYLERTGRIWSDSSDGQTIEAESFSFLESNQ